MLKQRYLHMLLLFSLFITLVVFISGCNQTVGFAYTPPFIPITFHINTSGNISLSVSGSIITEVGTFALDAETSSSVQPQTGSLVVIIRHRQGGSIVDTVYRIQTDQEKVIVVTNGRTIIQITDNSVTIDASDGSVQSITITDAQTQAKILLYDPLKDNSKGYGWDEWDEQSEKCVFSGQSYRIAESQSNYMLFCLATNTNFSNFYYQVQMRITKGDGGGLIFRVSSDLSKQYLLKFSQDGTYYLQDYQGNVSDSGNASGFNTGLNQTNLIAVSAEGNTLTAYVNQQKVTSINETSSSSGEIGLFAENDGNSTEVVFTDAMVWQG